MMIIGIDAVAQKSVIKADLISPVFNTLVVAYERVTSENGAFQLGFTLMKNDWYRRVGLTPEYRFYVSDKPAPTGFFVAPFFQYFDVTDKNSMNQTENYSEFGLGAVAGYQWMFKDLVTFSAFLGPKYTSNSRPRRIGQNSTIQFNEGFAVRAGLTLGLVF